MILPSFASKSILVFSFLQDGKPKFEQEFYNNFTSSIQQLLKNETFNFSAFIEKFELQMKEEITHVKDTKLFLTQITIELSKLKNYSNKLTESLKSVNYLNEESKFNSNEYQGFFKEILGDLNTLGFTSISNQDEDYNDVKKKFQYQHFE